MHITLSFLKPWSCVGVLWLIYGWTGFDSSIIYIRKILTDSKSSVDPIFAPVALGIVGLVFAGIY